jgi:hypothetical protein
MGKARNCPVCGRRPALYHDDSWGCFVDGDHTVQGPRGDRDAQGWNSRVAYTSRQEVRALVRVIWRLRGLLQKYLKLQERSGGDAWCAIRKLPGAVKWLKEVREEAEKEAHRENHN